ncbi:DUF3558 domain-containing protein [Gordonia sp. X0973]|uniref:DUF3558 family protein n=1 Tax=Gordonia sp. X0973 TaxID=2742602 RepID=UPI0013EE1178|nr:DUF3558 family protein [Gordonia sp. X0973]QKT06971.1 DUF3558 domain-containing protein [Gordonia sp. X0973]
MPPTQPKKKRRGLVIGLSTAAIVVVIGLAAAVIAITTGHSPFTPSDPTPTLKGVRGDESGWTGHLPDPCTGIPDTALRAAGLDPSSRAVGEAHPKASYQVMLTCLYNSPVPPGGDATETWGFGIDYLVYTYQEHLDNQSRIHKKDTKLNGQPASIYRVEGWDGPGDPHTCSISVGTVFGTASYTVSESSHYPLTQEQACDKVEQAAQHVQPFTPTAPLKK